jgi:hypothetical protein
LPARTRPSRRHGVDGCGYRVGGPLVVDPPSDEVRPRFGRIPLDREEDTWINILNARDGAWGVGGRVLTNDDLVAGIMAAAGA